MVTIIVAEGPQNTWIKKDAGSLQRWWNNAKKRLGDAGQGLRDSTNVSRMLGEKMFDSYHQHMEKLRQTDDSIRSWTRDLNNCLDRAIDANSKNKMLDVIFWLSQINSRLKLVSSQKKELSDLVDEQLEEFYGQRENPIQSDYFKSSPDSIVNLTDPDGEFSADDKVVIAGVMDDIGRWVARRKMEKMYEKRLHAQKLAIRQLMAAAKSMVGQANAYLGRMGKARASGNIESYINDLGKVSELQSKFEAKFQEQFNLHFKEMIGRLHAKEEKLQKEMAEPEFGNKSEPIPDLTPRKLPSILDSEDPIYGDTKPINEPLGPTGTIPGKPLSEALDSWKLTPPTGQDFIQPSIPELKTPEVPKEQLSLPLDKPIEENIMTIEDDSPDVVAPKAQKKAPAKAPKKPSTKPSKKLEASEIENTILKYNHDKFYNELCKAATTNNPALLAAMMLKYSEQIDETDPDKSLELIAIAEGILNA